MWTEVHRREIETNRKFMVKKPLAVIRDMSVYDSKLIDKLQEAIRNPTHDTCWELEKAKNNTYSIGNSTHPLIPIEDLEFNHNKFNDWCIKNNIKYINKKRFQKFETFFLFYELSTLNIIFYTTLALAVFSIVEN